MAEATALRNNALPYPVYGVPYTVVFPLLDADGDLVTGGGGDTPDSEVSKNGDTFADCTNEMTEIATGSGIYYLTLTAAEMTADIVAIICKTATAGTKTTPIVLYPRKLVPLRSGTSQGGAAGYITLDASAGTLNDTWNGCLCVATIDTNIESRIIDDYDGSNEQASVTPNWNVTPDADDTFVIYLPEGMQIPRDTRLPYSAADAAGGLPISDAGGLDLDDIPKRLDRNADLVESQRGSHTWQGNYYHVETTGDTHANGNRGGRADPYVTLQDCLDNAVTTNNHDVIFLGPGTHTTAATVTISKNYVFIRGMGRNAIITRTGSGDTLLITGDGVEISGAQIGTAATGSGDGIHIEDADFARIHDCWFLDTRGDGIHILRGSNCKIHDNDFDGTGVAGSGDGIHIVGTGGSSNGNNIFNNEMHGTLSDAILIEQGTTNDTLIHDNDIHDAGGWGINIGGSSNRAVVYGNVLGNNSSGDITDGGSNSIIKRAPSVDANDRVDLGSWLGTAVTVSGTSAKPEVDTYSVSDDAAAANNLELATENAAAGHIAADVTHFHGSALTETPGQIAARFTAFFDQAASTFSVNTALSSFKASGTSTLTQTQVTGGAYALDTDANGRIRIVDGTGAGEIDTASGTVALRSATQASIDAIEADLPGRITKNTALANFTFFMVLTSDHVTGGTGLTVTAQRSIDGAAFAGCANSVTEIANGLYKISLAASDLNGDVVCLKFTAATADARILTIVTQPT